MMVGGTTRVRVQRSFKIDDLTSYLDQLLDRVIPLYPVPIPIPNSHPSSIIACTSHPLTSIPSQLQSHHPLSAHYPCTRPHPTTTSLHPTIPS